MMSEQIAFIVGITFLLAHELDAIRCKEWRIFPGLSTLSDHFGERIFIMAHIPLFFIVFYQLMYHTDNSSFIKGFDIFMIVHVALHILFLRHQNNKFKDWLSWTLIIGAGLFGLLDLI